MSKGREIPPLYPTFHDYNAALKVYIQETTMLVSCCRSLLSLNQIEGKGAEILKERLDALEVATSGR